MFDIFADAVNATILSDISSDDFPQHRCFTDLSFSRKYSVLAYICQKFKYVVSILYDVDLVEGT